MMKSPLNEDASSIAVIWRRDAFVTYLHNLNCWTSCHHFVGYFQQAPFRFGFRLHEGDLGEQATASSIFIIFKPNLSNLSSVCVCLRVCVCARNSLGHLSSLVALCCTVLCGQCTLCKIMYWCTVTHCNVAQFHLWIYGVKILGDNMQ